MKFAILTGLAAVASAASPAVLERQLLSPYPMVPVLPVPGYNNSPDGFNSLGSIYTSSAGQLSSQANALAQKNVALSGAGGVQYNYDLKASLASSLNTINNLFWQTTIAAEQKVCSIVTSINQQNVNTVQGQLRAGIIAEAQAVVAITVSLTNTINAVKAQTEAFADSEKEVIASVIAAIAAAATASVGPAARLGAGLSATGVTGLNEVIQSLQSAVASLQTAAKINWSTS